MKKVEMNTLSLEERKSSFRQFLLGYSNSQAIKEANRCLNCKNPRCVNACPIGNHIPDFIKEVVKGNIEGAYQILLDRTVLPEICGMVCPHEKQCQGSCVKGIKGDPLTIGALEKYVAEYVRINNLEDLSYELNGKSVAIVGSGPAGMTSAYYLAKKGFAVTVYEKEDYLGGVLTWGIPSFRLDKTIIKHYFERLRKLNVEFKMNCNIGKDISVNELIDKYDFVILAVGALIPNKMNIEGEDLPYIIQARDFLTELSKMNDEEIKNNNKYGRNIIVVGGGNAAMDAARSAIRIKDVENVTVLYRRTEQEMPVSIDELTQAKEEGVKFMYLTTPVKYHENHEIECAQLELGEEDSSGRRRPVDTNKEHIYIQADSVIESVGFKNNPMICNNTIGLQKDDSGKIIVNEYYETTLNNVYAVGDSVSGPDTVVNAMKQALIASRHIIESI